MNRIDCCEVCNGTLLEPAIDLGDHPMCDDLLPIGDDRNAAEYPITIVFCPTCRTAHQAYQIPKQVLFPQSYHYRARHTADVLNGMKQLVSRVEDVVGPVKDRTVVDIGCNDGSLLSFFKERDARTVGIEPTGAAADATAAQHAVYNDYLTPAVAETVAKDFGQPDIVTFTNVFAHIENLHEVLQSLRALMGPNTLLVIENHYFGAVLDRYQFDTFYHEHPRTYSMTSFRHIAEALGLAIVAVDFPKRYGGNIRVMIGPSDLRSLTAEDERAIPDESDFGPRLRDMGSRIASWRDAKRALIAAAVAEYGPLPGKAFPGRAAILVKLLGLDASMISAVYEKPGSMKLGHYVAGTKIPIRSDEEFDWAGHGDAPILNLAWHISTEIETYLRGRGFSGPIIDIFGTDEFDRLSPLGR